MVDDMTARDIGRLQGEMSGVKSDLSEVKQLQKDMRVEAGENYASIRHEMSRNFDALQVEIKKINTTLDQARGSWKVLALLAGASTTLGAVVAYIFNSIGWIRFPPS